MFAFFTSLIRAEDEPQCTLTIKNYQGDVIAAENYSKNTGAFKIYPSDGCTNLTINESAYNSTFGIYEVGTYNISALPNANAIVSIVEVPEEERNIYYISAHAGSFPTMYATFKIIFERNTTDNIHLSIQRSYQFDYDNLTKNYTNLVFSNNTDSTNILNFTKEIARTDPKSYFIVSVDDMRVHLPLVWIINQGIPTNRYQINLITDGTSTYNYFYEGSFNKTDNLKALFETFKGTYEHHATGQKTNLGLLIHGGDIIYQMFPASSYENFKLYLTNKDMISSSEENATQLLNTMHIESIDIYDMINKQTEDKKEYMYKLAFFNKTEFQNEYFQDGKKPIMILGHGIHPKYPATTAFESSNINQAIANFKTNNLFFKPHPANIPSGELAEWMTSQGVKVFTKRINAEIIISAFQGKLQFGGYETSTYLTAKESDIAFVYVFNSISEFAAPFPQFVERGYFKNTSQLKYSDEYIPKQFIPKPTVTPTPAANNNHQDVVPIAQKDPTKSNFQKVGVPILAILGAIAAQALIIVLIVFLVIKFMKNAPADHRDNPAYP